MVINCHRHRSVSVTDLSESESMKLSLSDEGKASAKQLDLYALALSFWKSAVFASLLDKLTLPANKCVHLKDHRIVAQSSHKPFWVAINWTNSQGRVTFFFNKKYFEGILRPPQENSQKVSYRKILPCCVTHFTLMTKILGRDGEVNRKIFSRRDR